MSAIEEIRKAMGMSQTELAGACGINLHYVQAIENGSDQPTSLGLLNFAVALDVPVAYLHLLDDVSDDPLIKQFQEVARKTLGIVI